MIPLFSAEQVREADSFAINELKYPGVLLMENAAINICNLILKNYPYLDESYRFGIICGKGNNGGDGLALARQLLLRGFSVRVITLSDEKELKGDALTNYILLKNFIKDYPNSTIDKFTSISKLNKLSDCQIIVDALLGTGSSGNLRPPYDKIIKKLNSLDSIKIAIDLPSGLNLSNGGGELIFNAHLTITLAGLKTGLFYNKGKINSGKVLLGSIGIGEKYFDKLETNDFVVEPEDVVRFLPRRDIDANKYSAGKVLIIGGNINMPGAAIFATNAAMISGAGAGFLAIPNEIRELAQSKMNSAITLGLNSNEFLSTDDLNLLLNKSMEVDVVAIGPGLGRKDETVETIIEFLNKCKNKRIVIDADAIYAISLAGYNKLNLSGKVFTPHYGEFANLINISVEELKDNILNFGREFSISTGAYLVLKGAPTIIFNPEGEIFINSSGNSGLAKFGSGDVLTGIISAMVSQQEDVEDSLIAAVYLHGLGADLIKKNESEYGIIPDKLIEYIPKSIKFLRKSVV